MFYYSRYMSVLAFWISLQLPLSSQPLMGAQPEELEKVTVSLLAGASLGQFIRLPRIENVYPVVTGDEKAKEVVHTNASYLAETELSLGSLRALLTEASWKRYENQVLSLTTFDEDPVMGPYRKSVREAAADYPAICLGIKEIVEICKNLNDNAILLDKEIHFKLETVRFRVPSRIEWQFAARAVKSSEERIQKEHFPKWFDYSENGTLKGRVEDLQASLGENPDVSAVLGQADLISLADRAYDTGNKEGYLILGTVLQVGNGFESNIAKADQAGIRKCLAQSPSAWGHHRLLGNVAEWVLTETNSKAIGQKWEKLLSADDLSTIGEEEFGIVMGGDFVSLKPAVGSWLKYSIAGGNPVDGPETRLPEPYAVGDCLDENSVGIGDTNGGVRLLMVRQLSADWFVTLRGETFLKRTKDPLDQVVTKFTRTLDEICPIDERVANHEMVKFYRQLTANEEQLSVALWKEMLAETKSIGERYAGSPKKTAATKELDAIIGDPSRFFKKKPKQDESATKPSRSSKGGQADFLAISQEIAEIDFRSPN